MSGIGDILAEVKATANSGQQTVKPVIATANPVVTTSQPVAPVLVVPQDSSFKPCFSIKGEQLVQDLVMCFPEPVLIIGGTGWGKSVAGREAARRLSLKYTAINAYPGMDLGLLVGMWHPIATDKGVTIQWQDGTLTKAVREGMVYFFEELTRAPKEAMSRLHGLLDTQERYWSIPEAGQREIPVHPQFWFLGSANPAGDGYQAQKLERAIQARFIATFVINEPIADEEKILAGMGLDKAVWTRMLSLANDCRYSTNGNRVEISTRDLVLWGRMIGRNFSPEQAFLKAVMSKFPDKLNGLQVMFRTHFGDEK